MVFHGPPHQCLVNHRSQCPVEAYELELYIYHVHVYKAIHHQCH